MAFKNTKPIKPLARKLGRAIRQARMGQEISQDELAWRADVHRAYMGFVERGEYDISVVKLVQIANALKMKPSQILQAIDL